jgi:predicted nucleic acid-binding protein
VRSIIVDSGPLLALFNPADREHQRCVNFLRGNKVSLVTTWPVLTEVMHLLRYSVDAQLRLLSWIDRGGLALGQLEQGSIGAIATLIGKYRDRPMDLADASVVQLAVQTGCREVLSIDSDFDIYRLPDGAWLKNPLRDDAH